MGNARSESPRVDPTVGMGCSSRVCLQHLCMGAHYIHMGEAPATVSPRHPCNEKEATMLGHDAASNAREIVVRSFVLYRVSRTAQKPVRLPTDRIVTAAKQCEHASNTKSPCDHKTRGRHCSYRYTHCYERLMSEHGTRGLVISVNLCSISSSGCTRLRTTGLASRHLLGSQYGRGLAGGRSPACEEGP